MYTKIKLKNTISITVNQQPKLKQKMGLPFPSTSDQVQQGTAFNQEQK